MRDKNENLLYKNVSLAFFILNFSLSVLAYMHIDASIHAALDAACMQASKSRKFLKFFIFQRANL